MTQIAKKQGKTILWLISLIEEFLTINDLDNDGSVFGWWVSKDNRFVQRLWDGGDVTTGKLEEVLEFLQKPVVLGANGKIVRKLKPLSIKPKELP